MNAEARRSDARRLSGVISSASSVRFAKQIVRVLILAMLSLAACTPQATLFVPPTAEAVLPSAVAPATTVTPAPTLTPTLTPTPIIVSPTPCTDDLSFVQDVTVPDGTSVTPGERVDKQWLVTNSGTCNWDASYRLKLITGDAMGAPTEQALYPARAGTQATLRIVFTAPAQAGNYASAWQAVAPDGTTFGQALTIQINVTTP
jgi:hypothetical protein